MIKLKNKTCPECGKEKPLDEFGYRVSHSTGNPIAQSHCISCRSVKHLKPNKAKKKISKRKVKKVSKK